MKLKKSYKGFVLWFIFFCLSMIPVIFVDNVSMGIRLCMGVCLLDIDILLCIIYKTENIYWFSGMDYEDAVLAGSERRKIYAKKQLDRFLFFTLLYVLYTLFAQVLSVTYWLDIIIFIVGLIITVISTIRFQL